MKKIFMIAGPNGARKTTTAFSFLSCDLVDEFINADEIARGLAPFFWVKKYDQILSSIG